MSLFGQRAAINPQIIHGAFVGILPAPGRRLFNGDGGVDVTCQVIFHDLDLNLPAALVKLDSGSLPEPSYTTASGWRL